MKTIEVQRKQIYLKAFIKRSAVTSDYETLITEDCLITENGIARILYLKLDDELTKFVRQSCKNIKYVSDIRTGGLKFTARIFGLYPRNSMRQNYCHTASLAQDFELENNIVCDFGKHLSKLYQQYFPQVFEQHTKIVNEKVLPEWKIKGTPFTSGIVNKNNPLKYHFDGGNIKDVLSNMIVFKKDIEGGYLSCPEFNIGFEVADNTVILFDGQNIMHGVTPIKKLHDKAYRYSIVYYTLKQMWNCLPITEEILRARQVRLKRETKRASGEITKEDLQYDKVKRKSEPIEP